LLSSGPISEQAHRLLGEIRTIDLTSSMDEMYVAYLAVGLVAFEDMAGHLIGADTLASLECCIRHCGAWLDLARTRRPFGMRETQGHMPGTTR
jgi:hypothetical protein